MLPLFSSPTKSLLTVFISFIAILMLANSANAATTLTSDLQALVTQGNNINTQLSLTTLTADNSCVELERHITSIEAFTTSLENLSASLAAPVTVDTDSLSALNDLAAISASIASTLPVFSTNINAMAATANLTDIQAALDAMLILSDDIGTMADRILEMADKILVMADNIGLMADRIIQTQEIQSTNLVLTQASMLSTQKNIITLMATIDTSIYNDTLNSLISTGNILSFDIDNSQLTNTNMDVELSSYSTRVSNYLKDLMLFYTIVGNDSKIASHNIDCGTFAMLENLSSINLALADALNRFTQSVDTLAPETNSVVLSSAVYSMLRLASDISVMAGRIVEMGDKIIVMADNLGLMSDRIVATQTLQQSNLALSQTNLRTAQSTTVSVIAAFGL